MSTTIRAGKEQAGSALFYWGTSIEMQLGDHIEVRRMLRPPVRAQVCYIPGVSPVHRELEDSDPHGSRQWAYRTEDGSIYAQIYFPARVQPKKSIRFVARGDESDGIQPELELT